MDSATGVIDTLITNGSTATEIVQHIGEDLGNLGDLADGSPLEMVTAAIAGFTGGDLSDNPVTGIVQQGIDVVQGVESLKTEIINTGIDTVAGTLVHSLSLNILLVI